MIVIIFPQGSIRDVMKLAKQNRLKNCSLRLPSSRYHTTVIKYSSHVHSNASLMTIEQLAKFSRIQKNYEELLQLADDMRLQIPAYVILKNIMVKVVFEDTWGSRSHPYMKLARWFGRIKDVQRFIYDILEYQGLSLRRDAIQIIESRYTLGEWYWSSGEGIVLSSVLSKWGCFRDRANTTSSASPSNGTGMFSMYDPENHDPI